MEKARGLGLPLDVATSEAYCAHMEIGVRELKQRLSEILDRAAAGETIRITDRGRPKAILGPLPGVASLEAGIAAGWITPPSSAEAPRRVTRAAARTSVAASLSEDRGR